MASPKLGRCPPGGGGGAQTHPGHEGSAVSPSPQRCPRGATPQPPGLRPGLIDPTATGRSGQGVCKAPAPRCRRGKTCQGWERRRRRAGNGWGSARGNVPAGPGARGQAVSTQGLKPSGGAARNWRSSPTRMGPAQRQRRGWGWSGLGRMRALGAGEDGERGVEAPLRSGGEPPERVFSPPLRPASPRDLLVEVCQLLVCDLDGSSRRLLW